MARTRIFIVLVLAVTVGGAFAYGTYQYIESVPSGGSGVATRPVVIATTALDVGAELRADDLRLIEWPSTAVPGGAFASIQELVGRGVIMPMTMNEVVLPGKLASVEAGAGLPPAIPEGMRALSVRVNEVIGVAGYVLPGTRVDVVAIVTPTDDRLDTTSKVILTNVQVLAAGTKIERDVDKDKPVAVTVVTMLVNPDEAERLTLASTEGKIQLALRNPLDKTRPETTGIKPAALLGHVPVSRPARATGMGAVARVTAALRPAPAPAPVPTVEIIRGDKRAQEAVRQE
jgi:pilus assembly protein CpaB